MTPAILAYPERDVDVCPYLGGCRLYRLFKLRASLRTWQVRYCESDYTACERYKTLVTWLFAWFGTR